MSYNDEDWDDEDCDDEFVPDDAYDDDEDDTVPCPECGADVYEDSQRCPACGNYIVHSSSGYAWKNRPLWWIVLGALGMIAVILGLALSG